MNKMKMMIKRLARNHHSSGDELLMRRVHSAYAEKLVRLDAWTRG